MSLVTFDFASVLWDRLGIQPILSLKKRKKTHTLTFIPRIYVMYNMNTEDKELSNNNRPISSYDVLCYDTYVTSVEGMYYHFLDVELITRSQVKSEKVNLHTLNMLTSINKYFGFNEFWAMWV